MVPTLPVESKTTTIRLVATTVREKEKIGTRAVAMKEDGKEIEGTGGAILDVMMRVTEWLDVKGTCSMIGHAVAAVTGAVEAAENGGAAPVLLQRSASQHRI